ncbi:glycoside hydrolase family 99-like domain-containing protein [Pseudomonas viridiflava]|uniref:glycoside hydrolase family 99-like domain-containing protein n=2 Tax=Pseudomonas viridiflava TaxID=33069 RepID=UPI0020BE2A73|nr:glycoside hydrolase family 99-like domain-containing protein [Pseudomonas viridiflava]
MKNAPIKSLMAQANTAMREHHYGQALELYKLAVENNPSLSAIIEFNVKLAQKRKDAQEKLAESNTLIPPANSVSSDLVEHAETMHAGATVQIIEDYDWVIDLDKLPPDVISAFESKPDAEKLLIKDLALAIRSHSVMDDYINYGFTGGKSSKVNTFVYDAIAASKLFDKNWYTKAYLDVALSGVDPVVHYMRYGWKMGRDPSTKFSTEAYFDLNPDVYSAQINPLEHYIFQGLMEGRNFKRFLKIEELGTIDFPPIKRGTYSYIPEKTVKTICLFLPQYHAIPENDKWWGKGFTEWTNVKPAKPQFDGHYQPHVPHEDVGYYNLLKPETLKRQILQAKDYGIDGFCFYFYWFDGKRLLEKPIEMFHKDKSNDMPFCLCWANENWSRRWDGNESDILMAQNHSDQDDLKFIKYIKKYISDNRYIKVDGKPLVVVYRPAELPDAKRTASIWREYCRTAGVGEIYLAMTNSFEKSDPKDFGFDAVVDFTPNSAGLSPSNALLENLPEEFEGGLFNYENLVVQSDNYRKEDYTIFRGACPSWDNTARKKNKGYIFLNSSPVLYQKWLDNSIRYVNDHNKGNGENLVFINAWNEWAEGAHLEPDQKYGYAYLESTKMSLVKAAAMRAKKIAEDDNRLAVIIHAFYTDILEEFVSKLNENVASLKIKLYVSTPREQEADVEAILKASGFEYLLAGFDNLGRDVLPFLHLARIVAKDGYPIILKLHTKKSKHREDGDKWRNELVDKLVGHGSLHKNHQVLIKNQTVGVLSPNGHLVPLKNHWGGNAENCARLANRMGFEFEEIIDKEFPAGTMFFAQTKALLPLLNLAIDDHDFDEELGQTDGTFAHAIERMISISSLAAGLTTIEQTSTKTKKPYAFAKIG